MVYLTSDTHGELDRFKDGELRRAGKGDFVVVLGDFGFVWDGSKAEQKKLEKQREREAAAAKKKAERLQSKIETQLVSAGGRILRRGLLGILKR